MPGRKAARALQIGSASAFTLSLSSAQFSLSPTFNSVSSFQFDIDVSAPLAPGVYDNPGLASITYSVVGVLATGTPSGFPGFNLQRTMTGAQFYSQGSSLQFAISPGADLSDGLQWSELAVLPIGSVFRFDGREVDTGRYHPPLFELFADGTGQIQNSNNFGGTNPASLKMVDVDFGEEYVVALSGNPAAITLAVPEPSSASAPGAGAGPVSGQVLPEQTRHQLPVQA